MLTRKLNRLKNYDYSDDGWYFITICSKNRENIFWEYDKNIVGTALAAVRDRDKIRLSKLGQIIENQWNDIPIQNNNITLDRYAIMPNHIHGILIVNKRTGASPVPTISNAIGSFKSKTSVEYLRYIKKNKLHLSGQIWQRSFYDHIIRNEKSLQDTREYIINNPATWNTDENNTDSKKYQEKTILENYKKARNLPFSILETLEAQEIFSSYTGENPDYIINFNGNYIGVDLFMLCLNKSTTPIKYGGNTYTNQMQKVKQHQNIFSSLEELEENIKQRKEHPEHYPLTKQDDPFDILKERLSLKAEKVKNYVTSKNWLLGFTGQFFNMGMVKNIYEDQEVESYQSLIRKIVGSIEKIDRVILFETGTETKDKIFEYKKTPIIQPLDQTSATSLSLI